MTVFWKCLLIVLRRFEFSERIIDMVVRLTNSNWYSVLVNEQSFGFFQSSRGLKKGDPLSPTLFTAAEVLSRSLNNLFEDPMFKGYGMPKWNPKINNFSYASDTILFCSSHPGSMKKMIKILREYEKILIQLINLDKSLFYLHEKIPIGMCNKIKRITGIASESFPFTYFRCPIFIEERRRAILGSWLRKLWKD